jgi:hypothetical protein
VHVCASTCSIRTPHHTTFLTTIVLRQPVFEQDSVGVRPYFAPSHHARISLSHTHSHTCTSLAATQRNAPNHSHSLVARRTGLLHFAQLAYFDSVNLPLVHGCSTGSPMGNNPVQRPLPDDPTGYYKGLRAGFNTSWTLRDMNKSMATICV